MYERQKPGRRALRRGTTALTGLIRIARTLPLIALAAAAPTTAATGQDTITVQADNAPLWGSQIRLVEELRIGMIDGPDPYVLGQPEIPTVAPNGSIFVFDRQVPIIRQYDSLGRHVRDIGQGGQGPGEYRDVRGMRVFDDGRLAIWDIGNARMTVYDSVGSYLQSHAHHLLGRLGVGFVVDTMSNYYLEVSDMSLVARMARREAGQEWPTLFVKVSSSGAVIDSIAVPPAERTWPSIRMSTRDGWRPNFSDETVHALSNRGYLVVGHNRSYALDLMLPNGSVRRIVRTVGEEVRLTRGERAEWEARARFMQRFFRQHGRDAPDYPELPRTKPVFRALTVDVDGRIWVERYVTAVKRDVPPREPGDERPPYAWREPTTFDVIQPDGTFLGTIVLPEDTWAYQRWGMHICGVLTGELGEQYVVRLRIETGGS